MVERTFSFFLSLFVFSSIFVFDVQAQAKLDVVATTSDLGALVQEVAGDGAGGKVNLVVLAPGSRDPHYLEAKPSYMVKINRAELVVANGLSLEVGWLPSLLRGARNPKVMPGSKGYLELGPLLDPIEKPKAEVTRAMGDVHPEGNPHFTLDPVRLGQAAVLLAARLAELDAPNAAHYKSRAADFEQRMQAQSKQWKDRISKSGLTKVVTYHSSLNYLLERLGLTKLAQLEPLPGVPPSSQHILDVIALMKKEKAKLLLIENYFDTRIADRVAKDVPGAKVSTFGLAVGSKPELKTNQDVIEQIVKAIEGGK